MMIGNPFSGIFSRIRMIFTDPRMLVILAIVLIGALIIMSPGARIAVLFWMGVAVVLVLLVLFIRWMIKRIRARKAGDQIGDAVTESESKRGNDNADVEAMRERMREAVKSIKTSRLGETKGREALYELPWYMIIGNPAAGKSTAIVNSGLNFPFADEHGSIIQGIGGTRNCDWYFTSEGIILDTAGRYSVSEENSGEWLDFLDLLRKHRSRAPINGIIIAASIAELTGNRPEFAIDLAKKLRKRVQELTEWLEVVAPVYVVFTKADLISGFTDFFQDLDENERNQVWGATLPFDTDGNKDVVETFENHFDELSEGLKEMSLAQMALNQGQRQAPGMLTLPLEFAGIKSSLSTFIATLFEENPYQYRPVFRGFYFTSAVQEAAQVNDASDQITRRFSLDAPAAETEPATEPATTGQHSFFLLDMFRKVLFADKQLVRQHSSKSRKRRRYGILVACAVALGLVMGGWAWSYTNNRQLIANVQDDLDQATTIQENRVDLESRLHALQIIQDRLEQLQTYRSDHPIMLGLGLYQGNSIEKHLRREYFEGMQQVMLKPVTDNLETYLNQVVEKRADLATPDPRQNAQRSGESAENDAYRNPSPTNAQEAYNALRAYLMLAKPDKVEPTQLSDQLSRFWRSWLEKNRGLMSRDELIGNARKLMTFYVTQYDEPGWPVVDDNVALVEDSRSSLRSVMSGMSALDRVYAHIKARAATRYPSVTVASILEDEDADGILGGSYAVPGPFTEKAWSDFVEDAFKNAANNELSVSDWVLESSQDTDLTLSGSPEQIQKQLEEKYDKEYVSQWRKFLQGITVRKFANLGTAIQHMRILGDPKDSPLRTVLATVYAQTSWDNPQPVTKTDEDGDSGGFGAWFKRVILRHSPGEVHTGAKGYQKATANSSSSGGDEAPAVGRIGGHFTGIAQFMENRGSGSALFDRYMDMLSGLRTRLSKIDNRGNPGKGARKLMAATLSGDDSELASGLQLVDGQMLNGLDKQHRATLRPLLLRPLMQTFQALIAPTEGNINQIWQQQVYTSFRDDLADKRPFNSGSNIDASDQAMKKMFGATGNIADFVSETLKPMVNKHGSVLTPRQWAGMGITLSRDFLRNYDMWTSPLDAKGASDNEEVIFQFQPKPVPKGVRYYTIHINDQKLRYQNTPPKWKTFVWGHADGTPKVRIEATTRDGRSVSILKFVGDDALQRMVTAADQKSHKDDEYTLAWSRKDIEISLGLKIIKNPHEHDGESPRERLKNTHLPQAIVGMDNEDNLSENRKGDDA